MNKKLLLLRMHIPGPHVPTSLILEGLQVLHKDTWRKTVDLFRLSQLILPRNRITRVVSVTKPRGQFSVLFSLILAARVFLKSLVHVTSQTTSTAFPAASWTARIAPRTPETNCHCKVLQFFLLLGTELSSPRADAPLGTAGL